jgi:hypothetical protein
MERWKQFLSQKINRQSEDEPLEIERDRRFVSWLEEEGQFEARPNFQADLRARLQAQLVTQKTASRRSTRPLPLLFRLTSTLTGLAAILVFGLALVSGLPTPNNAAATPVAAVPTSDSETGLVQSVNDKLQYIYDQATQDYVKLDEVTKVLGFAPRLPEYLPQGYQVENLALTYGENFTVSFGSVRAGSITPGPANLTLQGPQGLQFQLVSGRAQDPNQIQVYQLRVPAEEGNNSRFNVQGAQGSNPKMIQGAMGYSIQGARWRLNYAGSTPPIVPPRNAKPAEGTPAAPPKNVTPGTQPKPPFMNGSIGKEGQGRRPPFPPQNFRPAQGRISFGQIESNNPNRPGFFIDFQPQPDGKPAHSLVWQKDGVLMMLVATDTFSDTELQRIADSFREQ